MPRILIIAVAALIAIVVGAAFIVPSLIPADVYRTQIETRGSEALGRPLTVAGPVSVGVFPRLQAHAQTVTIANAEGFTAEAFAQVEELRASLALLPLLSRRVEIKEFALVRPSISLEANAQGRNNWTFASSADAPAANGGGFVRRPGALPFEAALGDVRVVDGTATFVDRASGAEHRIEDLDLSLRMPSLSEPLEVDGSMLLDGDPVRIEARLDSLRSFFDGQAAPFFADLDAGSLVVVADGQFAPGEAVAFAGDVRIASNDLRALAAKAGASLPAGQVYRQFELSGRASGDAERVAFDNARFAFDDIAGTGGLALDLSGARPNLTGSLALGALDVTPYLGEAASGDGGSAGGPVPPWSEDPIDFGPLKAIDADLSVTAESIRSDALEFGRSTLRTRLVNGRLQIDIQELNAYEGTGTAQVVVDASGSTPQLALTADLANLQARPFLAAAARFSRLSGVGGAQLNLTASGGSQAAIMRSLDGAGGFAFQNGAIEGVNIAAAIRGLDELRQGRLNLQAFNAGAETDFTDLIGQFAMQNGVATIREFRLSSPLVRVTGSGELNIAEQTLDLNLEPRAVASIQGQGGATDLSGIGVPLQISGSWGSVEPGIDQEALQRIIAQQAIGAVGGDAGRVIDDALGNNPAGGLLRDALGLPRTPSAPATNDGADAPADDAPADDGGADAAPDQESEEEQDPAERLLQGIFGGPD